MKVTFEVKFQITCKSTNLSNVNSSIHFSDDCNTVYKSMNGKLKFAKQWTDLTPKHIKKKSTLNADSVFYK